MIKAIETSYRGCRFRSRLEARWAVFFDALGIKWEYEKEGFELDGRRYLPDFWIPYEAAESGWGWWIEIKPTPLDKSQIELLSALAKETGHRTYALCGEPWPDKHSVWEFQHHHHVTPANPTIANGRLVELRDQVFDRCIRIVDPLTKRQSHFVDSYAYWSGRTKDLQGAFVDARSARFEHGESGPKKRAGEDVVSWLNAKVSKERTCSMASIVEEAAAMGFSRNSLFDAKRSLPIESHMEVTPDGRKEWIWQWDDGRYSNL